MIKQHIQQHLKINESKVKEAKEQFLKEMKIFPEPWISPRFYPLPLPPVPVGDAIRRRETTLHEGDVLYLKYWNYWVRAGERAEDRLHLFFPDFENPNPRIFRMIDDIGVTTAPSSGERHIWEKIAGVWQWLGDNVTNDGDEYATIGTHEGWPSIDDYAAYYEAHGHLVWAACFSKAHLFATILGRVGIPRWRIAIATAHHTEGGAPPTASHVFVAVYVAERWFYLDPTFVFAVAEFPGFDHKGSIGLFETVDYQHPFETIPIPLSGFDRVPLLPE